MLEVGDSIVPAAVFEVRTVRHLPALTVARLQLLPAPLAPFKIAQMLFQLRHDINESGHKVGPRSIVLRVVGLEPAPALQAQAMTRSRGPDQQFRSASTRRRAASIALVANDLALRASPTLLATLWNEFTRVTTFFAIALLISSVRHSTERLRDESARAFRLAVTDPLTGLYNRHYLNEQLERIHPAAARHHRPYALLALDLDGFKRINDTAGHVAGDAALVAFALELSSVVRGDDIVVRTGGDEFVVLLPEASVADAVALAGRLQAAVRESGGANLIRSLSAGAVAWAPYSTPAGLIAEADRLVYESKRVGGGRVSVNGRDEAS